MSGENRFRRTREDHSRETAEDYVELVSNLISELGEARAVDLATRLGVSPVTVGKTLQRLHREGYVLVKPYRSIFLTEKGKELAEQSQNRHDLVLKFLIKLGVSPEAAEIDTEGIEHHVSEKTLVAMQDFLNKP